ncbi:hypothetical protein [Salinibaculum salinum]|uniref:hypothetical protein n=1 Tax=Salinibaculum salinum TaxID=3131996 RepID=UPI0030EE5741
MKLPRGQLVRQRVVSDVGTVLSTALENALTGYARLESQDALLLDADGTGVLTFEKGIPVVAYHTSTDSAGADALADIAVAGPYRLELYELDSEALTEIHTNEQLQLSPELPAERLAGDPELAERTLAVIPDEHAVEREEPGTGDSAVEAFLDDEAKIASIQERARDQARERAKEWGFKR